MTEFQKFEIFLRQYGKVVGWSVLASTAFPAALVKAGLNPPWPPGIATATGVAEFFTIILIYSKYKRSQYRGIFWRVIVLSPIFIIVSCLYFTACSFLTITVKLNSQIIVRGLQCTEYAKSLFNAECPFVGDDALKLAEFEPSVIWTQPSISAAKLTLFFLWIACALTISAMTTLFVLLLNKRA